MPTRRTVVRIAVALGLSTSAVADDWPCFLGPQQTGVSAETGLLDSWPQSGPPLMWSRDVGTGYSAPSIRGERLVLHHRQGAEEVVECFHPATGEPLWKYAYESHFTDPYGYNNGPRCSPLLTADRCYTLGAEGRLVCLQLADGKLLWQRDLHADFTIPDGFFGVGCSPILEGERLIVLVGGRPDAAVVAFHAADGRTLWQAAGRSTWNGVPDESGEAYQWTDDEMLVSYSSPIAATIHGQRHVLCLLRHGLVSLDPATGTERFKFWFRPVAHESVNAARPVVVDDTILLSAAYRLGAVQLRVRPDGKHYDVVWRDAENLLTHWSTAIAVDGCYYGFSGRHEQDGELRCLRASDGAVQWTTTGWDQPLDALGQNPVTGEIVDKATGRAVPWPFYGRGSAILADGKFIVLGERGTLALVRAAPQRWEELCRCSAPHMTYPSWAAPVLCQGRLYLRDENSLICLDLRTTTPRP